MHDVYISTQTRCVYFVHKRFETFYTTPWSPPGRASPIETLLLHRARRRIYYAVPIYDIIVARLPTRDTTPLRLFVYRGGTCARRVIGLSTRGCTST